MLQSSRWTSWNLSRTRAPWRRAAWSWTAPCPTPGAASAGTKAATSSCPPNASRSAAKAATANWSSSRWRWRTKAPTACRSATTHAPPSWPWKVNNSPCSSGLCFGDKGFYCTKALRCQNTKTVFVLFYQIIFSAVFLKLWSLDRWCCVKTTVYLPRELAYRRILLKILMD